jgi:hypothetical protein
MPVALKTKRQITMITTKNALMIAGTDSFSINLGNAGHLPLAAAALSWWWSVSSEILLAASSASFRARSFSSETATHVSFID